MPCGHFRIPVCSSLILGSFIPLSPAPRLPSCWGVTLPRSIEGPRGQRGAVRWGEADPWGLCLGHPTEHCSGAGTPLTPPVGLGQSISIRAPFNDPVWILYLIFRPVFAGGRDPACTEGVAVDFVLGWVL